MKIYQLLLFRRIRFSIIVCTIFCSFCIFSRVRTSGHFHVGTISFPIRSFKEKISLFVQHVQYFKQNTKISQNWTVSSNFCTILSVFMGMNMISKTNRRLFQTTFSRKNQKFEKVTLQRIYE